MLTRQLTSSPSSLSALTSSNKRSFFPTRDILMDVSFFSTCSSCLFRKSRQVSNLKAPRIIFSCTICIPLRTVLRFILPVFAFGIRFRLSGFCVTFGAFSLPLILLNCSSMPPHREVSEPPSTLCSNALQNYCFYLTWQWLVPQLVQSVSPDL